MAHSYGEHRNQTCPECGQTFETEVWLTVDTEEQPGLAERIQEGSLHQWTCPRCGHGGEGDAPILLYRPGEDALLLFSPAQETSEEEDREQATGLVTRLREQLGDDWQDEWVVQGLRVVPRPVLPVALVGAEPLLKTLQEFMQARTWAESHRLVEQHPELLTDEADGLLEGLLAAAREREDADAERVLEEHRTLLQQCRELGVAQAFADKMGITTQDLAAAGSVAQLPADLREVLAELVASGVEIKSPEDLERVLAERPDLREKLEAPAQMPPGVDPILRELSQLGRPGDMPRRVRLSQQVLDLVDRGQHPSLWAALQVELGNSLAQNPLGDRATNLEQAIQHYQQALEVMTRQAMPVEWATTMMNLANAYRNRIRGERADNIELAIQHYQQALEEFGPEALPDDCRRAARNLGSLLFGERRWGEAVVPYQLALQAAENLYQASLSLGGREAELAETGDLYRRAGYALAQTGKPRQAAVTLERGRARGLGDALARDRADLKRLEQEAPEVYQRYQDAAAGVRQLETSERGAQVPAEGEGPGPTPQELRRQREVAWRELRESVKEIQGIPGYQDFLILPRFKDIAAAVQPERPVVYLVVTPAGGVALAVRQTSEISETSDVSSQVEVEAVWADGFTMESLDRLLVQHDGENVTGGYLPGQLLVSEWLEESLTDVLPALGERLMGPLAEKLRGLGAGGVTLVPCGRLGLLPLHAARYSVNGKVVCFLDEFDVAYAPSARTMNAAQQALQVLEDGSPSLAGVGNPLPNPKPLPFAQAELEEVAGFFPEGARRPLYEEEASRSALLERLPGASYVHLACHGLSDPGNPLESRLELSDGEALTLEEVLDEVAPSLAGARLAVLSACQSAIPEFRRLPDEAIGLPMGFFQAGVPGVVGTLWSVNDLSTALLMVKFYEYHLEGDKVTGEGPLAPARALCKAQRWLREVTAGELLAYFREHQAMERARREAARDRMSEEMAARGIIRFALDEPDFHPFADKPYHWAPFIFVGV